MNYFQIQGINYRRKNKQQSTMNPYLLSIVEEFYGKSKPKLPNVNIVSEFELIQKKQSNLSRSQRNSVEYEFNKRYEVYSDEQIKIDKERYEKFKNILIIN